MCDAPRPGWPTPASHGQRHHRAIPHRQHRHRPSPPPAPPWRFTTASGHPERQHDHGTSRAVRIIEGHPRATALQQAKPPSHGSPGHEHHHAVRRGGAAVTRRTTASAPPRGSDGTAGDALRWRRAGRRGNRRAAGASGCRAGRQPASRTPRIGGSARLPPERCGNGPGAPPGPSACPTPPAIDRVSRRDSRRPQREYPTCPGRTHSIRRTAHRTAHPFGPSLPMVRLTR